MRVTRNGLQPRTRKPGNSSPACIVIRSSSSMYAKRVVPAAATPLPSDVAARRRQRHLGEARQHGRHLHDRDDGLAPPGLVLLAVHEHRQVEAAVAQHRERVARIDGQRRQHRPHLAREVAPTGAPSARASARPGATRRMPALREARRDVVAPAAVQLRDHGVGARADGGELLGRRSARRAGVSTTLPDSCCLRPATRTMKNSSRFDATMATNFRRSTSGTVGSRASSSTRSLNPSHDSSRLMNSFAAAGSLTDAAACRRRVCAGAGPRARSLAQAHRYMRADTAVSRMTRRGRRSIAATRASRGSG